VLTHLGEILSKKDTAVNLVAYKWPRIVCLLPKQKAGALNVLRYVSAHIERDQ
jgi:hypothetical protein